LASPAEEQPDAKERPDSEVSSAVTPNPPDQEKIAARLPSAPTPSLPQLEHQEIAASPPISRPPARDQFDQKEVTVLLNRGKNLIASGDLAAARIVLRRAVDANNTEAALALAATYDPFVLRELKVYGFTGDAAMARSWYEKAAELGSLVATRRLEILTRATDRPLR
jgi:tetratricopeptide (TPR) repeat protein